ncbi:MAG: pyridoxal 5'-phosphate synthase glutaminase subunit PdxT [Actinomycetota bacterium]|nr:pyridoxal 5'-phosphate synthase glutaminase subunit PdxT [Actinomycetota bacterium]
MAGKILNIGVLALQGASREHITMLERCRVRGVAIKKPSGLKNVDGIVIPGGESTTIGKLIDEYEFMDEIRGLANGGFPVFGTCAGMVVLAKKVNGSHGKLLRLIDITVNRNAFGRQVDSFEADIEIRGIEREEIPFRAVFIRAPFIEEAGDGVRVMAEVEGKEVMARQGNILVSAFHPELTDDSRVHEYFLRMVRNSI